MGRVTEKDLNELRDRLNRIAGTPKEYVQGSYQFCKAYGGTRLVRVGENGGTEDISGFLTKRELYSFMGAFIKGLICKH